MGKTGCKEEDFMGKHPRKTKSFIAYILVMAGMFLLAGCASHPNTTQAKIGDLVDVSPSHITSIKVSEGGGPQVVIEDPRQIEQLVSFLSSVTVHNQYTEQMPPSDSTGGGGDYFLITYSDGSTSHIQFYADAGEIQLYGKTAQGETQGKWRVYPLEDFSQQEELDAIISMAPTN